MLQEGKREYGEERHFVTNRAGRREIKNVEKKSVTSSMGRPFAKN